MSTHYVAEVTIREVTPAKPPPRNTGPYRGASDLADEIAASERKVEDYAKFIVKAGSALGVIGRVEEMLSAIKQDEEEADELRRSI